MVADHRPDFRAARIDLAATPDFDLGEARVRPARRQVCWGDGLIHELQPRVMQVLVALASARPAVVSRDVLVKSCWGGRIVGDDAINRCIVALRHLAHEIVPTPFSIETVPRVGYCLSEGGARESPAPRISAKPGLVSATTRSILGWARLDRKFLLSGVAALLIVVISIAALDLMLPWRRANVGLGPASIAVLPFRSVSTGNPHLAEGLSGEILGQLSRDPQFQVAGRTSSSMFGNAADLREVGRRLNVAYALEGSVQTEGGRVRVNAALVQTSNGMQLWSHSYNGSEDDIFAIQQQIAGEIAIALKRKLVRNAPLSGPLLTRGDVYNLYLTARGLMRTRQPANMRAAEDLLRRAVKSDPGYAPAWSSLGAVIGIMTDFEDADRRAARQQEALGYVRRALQLSPNLAEAHGALGMVLRFSSPEAASHIKRAVQLDPSSAENIFWLGNIHGNAGEFPEQLRAYHRASQIDPLVINASMVGAPLAVKMGYRREAEAWVRRFTRANPLGGPLLQGDVAFAAGDFSGAVKAWTRAAQSNDPDTRTYGRELAAETLAMMRMADGTRRAGPGLGTDMVHVFMQEPPTREEWRSRNGDSSVSEQNYDHNLVGAKLLINAGRQRELVSTYDGAGGLLGLSAQQRRTPHLVKGGAIVALALRESGRGAEADRLLAQADRAILILMRRGRVPFSFYADAAEVWAVQGKQDQALAALGRAVDLGWVHAGMTDLPDLADEPVFRSLRGNPRFERLRTRLDAHMQREKRETARLTILNTA